MDNEDPVQMIIEDIELEGAVLFHDQFDEPYIAYKGDGRKVSKLSSNEFKQWVTRMCWHRYHKVLSPQITNNMIQLLSGIARLDGPRHVLNVRLTRDDSAIWYDCGNGQPAIRISMDGWRLVTKPPILFKRLSHQRAQVMPSSDGDLGGLANYVNIHSENDWLLFQVYLVAAFIPDFPHPLLILHGPQGSGKSTPMRVMKELIDPSAIRGISAPKDIQSFVQLASHHAFLFFDNLSSLPTWLSDALARASTGDGFSKRKLYTDDDDVVYTLQRTIAINGINQVITKPDLLDRSILIKLERIQSGQRISEKEFWQLFEIDRPAILGAIFDVLSKALKRYPEVKLTSMPRMADFASWGYAIAEAIGYRGQDFLDAYKANIAIQNDEAIEASPVAQAVIALMDTEHSWEGTAADLLVKLNLIAFKLSLDQSYIWPKGPVWLTRRINEVQTNLSARGITILQVATSEGRITKITKDADSTEISVDTDIDEGDSMTVKAVNTD
jgi:hypothetical protein